jgi:tRNA/rRNA methyltransferase/tRNA (cytidine32/uridine32-2'-O)-methyltransferase
MNPDTVDVVLVRASRPANVAAACRAMKNMGLTRLRLVAPPPGLGDDEPRALAYGAWDVLDGAQVAATLRDAVAGATLVVGTSGRPLPDAWSPRRLAEEGPPRAGGGRTALVFGPESSGLRNDELALCHVTVHIPADPVHPSLNLAQAVLVLAYEIRMASTGPARFPNPERATAGEIEAALDDLGAALLAIGYLNPDNPDKVLAELRGLLARAGATARETTLLRGMARQIRWAAGSVARDHGPNR